MADSILIERRFNGPPDSGNGGYTCGRLAQYVSSPAVEVTLRLPPPLVKALTVELGGEGDGGAVLLDGDTTIAEARPVELDLEPPPPVAAAAAAQAAEQSGFLDAEHHPFPTCFVCGPLREPGDGLRIFTGPIDDRRLMAATWTAPSDEFRGHLGVIYDPIVWAALDCPTSAPVWNDPNDPDFRPIVLARLTVRIDADVHAREKHTIVAWPIEVDGRKRHAGAALYDSAGELKAVSRALWIELKPPAEAASSEAAPPA